MPDLGLFDYIIVGAGSAGCVLASRLSADPSVRVLLVEAGGHDRHLWVHIPIGYAKLFDHPTLNWRFATEPEPGLKDRRISQPRGKLLGGSSSINGLIYIRGQREDFETWRAEGRRGGGYDDLLPYFRRAERQARGADQWHGADGPLSVSDQSEPHPLCDAFIAAAAEAGHPINGDFNGRDQEGAGYYQMTTRAGRRWSTARAYLAPARSRTNLKVLTNCLVHRVLLDQRRAIGVEWSSKDGLHRAVANHEVLLSAGAINTPQLLQLSGIGPGALLRRQGIPVALDAPGVGGNFQDHLQVRAVFRSAQPVTLNDDLACWYRTLGIGARYLFQRKGPLTISAGYAGGFFKARDSSNRPDIQVHFLTFSTARMGDRLDPYSAFTASSCQLRPTSRGHVQIASPDPAAAPSILANYLGTEEDCRTNIAGLRLIRDIMRQPAMAPYMAGEIQPGAEASDDDALLEYARATGGSIYHPSCSVRMGGKDAPLDPSLRLRGVRGLRVVDASAMPSVVSGNTSAAVIAIAERAADLIVQDRLAAN